MAFKSMKHRPNLVHMITPDGIYLGHSTSVQIFILECKWSHSVLLTITLFFPEMAAVFPNQSLAHLSAKCSGWAIVISHRPSICPSVNNFKNLLQNHLANLDKTWQECSVDEALQKLLKEFNSIKNSGCHGNKMAENGEKKKKKKL